MDGSKSKIIRLDSILSDYESGDVIVLQQDLKQFYKPSLFELTVKTKKRLLQREKVDRYFVKLCEQDTKVKIRVNILARFNKEINFYRVASRAITDYQETKGVVAFPYYHLFPKHIGSRVSVDEEKMVPDTTGVLILGNLKSEGYTSPDATVGLLWESCRLVLTRLAYMHVAPLAMRICNLHFFKQIVLPCLFDIKRPKRAPSCFNDINNMLDELLILNSALGPHLPSIKEAIDDSKHYNMFGKPIYDDTWFSLCHSNFSQLHLMLKYDNGKPISCKILDLQGLEYSHCLNDLIFFLFTSVNNNYLKVHFRSLVSWYFDCFIYSLTMYEVNLGPYTFANFYEELNIQGRRMIIKIIEALAYFTCEGYGTDGEPILGQRFKQKLTDTLIMMIYLGWIEKIEPQNVET